MKIKIAEKEVIANGTLILFLEELVEFELNEQVKYSLYIQFFSDKNISGTEVKAETYGENSLILKFTNIIDSLGTSNAESILIGVLNGQKLYFDYAIYGMGSDKRKVLHYTFKLGEKVQK